MQICTPLSRSQGRVSDTQVTVRPVGLFFSTSRELSFTCSKGGSRTGPPGARPRFEKFGGFVLANFDCITRIYFDVSQYTMFTMCILFTTLATKT